MSEKITLFTIYNNRGNLVLRSELLAWKDPVTGSDIFGPVTKYSWMVDGVEFTSPSTGFWRELPDASGFICFESEWKPDNCLLLDAYGKERMRLTVPWEMTGAIHPTASQPPTCFENISEPYDNPETGEKGKFGVTAHIADVFGCKFYFELNYHTGEFLWCKKIRD